MTTESRLRIPNTIGIAPRALVATVISAYQALFSPLLTALFGPACRFEPSCSAYAHAAIRGHGVWRGGYMAARRILRCRPMGGCGYDPVPSRVRRTAQP